MSGIPAIFSHFVTNLPAFHQVSYHRTFLYHFSFKIQKNTFLIFNIYFILNNLA
jgi:hypothetical protein